MEFDHSYNGGPADWNFPSPNATPTHASFGSNLFQTPKASSFPTHFQDAFATPQMPSYSTPQQPQFSAMTPGQRPQTSSDTLRSNYYANIQAVGGQSVGQSMSPLVHMDAHGSTVSPTYGEMHTASMQMPMNTSFDSMQMQTPPPTRGMSNRKPQQAQEIAFGTPSTIASRRFMTPQHAAMPMQNAWLGQEIPAPFPQLQFSPDMYQFANLGPASAPIMPHSRILWEQAGSPIQPLPQPTLDDPFAPATSTPMGWPNTESKPDGSKSVTFDTPAMSGFPVQAPHRRPRRMTDNLASSVGNDMTSSGVDPSLLYSGPARPVVRSNGRSDNLHTSHSDLRTKKDTTIQTHNRSGTVSSTDTVTNPSTSNLQRSKTTVSGRLKNVLKATRESSSLNRSNSVNQVPRTTSPVKRIGRPPFGSASEGRPRQRASVVLTVDENGIARTETTRVDQSPTRSIRERYPALFDSDSSDVESNASDTTLSRPSSFVFDKRDERKSKAARLDPPVENLEGLSIPRSGSSASMKKGLPPSRAVVAATAQLRRQSSLRRSTPSRNSRRNLTSSSTSSLIDTCPMEEPVEPQQSTIGGRRSENSISHIQDGGTSWPSHTEDFDIEPSSAESALEVHNRRWSMMSFEQQQQRPSLVSPPQQQYYHPVFSSPTIPSHQTRQLQIRCQCGWSDDRGQPLVQCHSCTQYCHGPCVGLSGQSPPTTFTCFLCTKPPSRPSGGRSNVSGR